jgi:hypothetical protein
MTDALLITLVVLVCASLLLNCAMWGLIADLRSRGIDDRAILRNLDSLERGTNDRVAELHRKWVRDRAEGRQ